MKNKVSYVYFDIGGVFFDWKQALAQLARHLGTTEEAFWNTFVELDAMVLDGTMSTQQLWREYKKRYPNAEDIDEFLVWWTDRFEPYHETHKLVHDVIKKYRVGLITNIYPDAYPQMLQKGHVPDLPYEVVVESCRVGSSKPDDKIFIHAEEQANVPPTEIFFIDDSQRNITAANARGWQGFLFNEDDTAAAAKEIRRLLDV